MPNPPPGRFHRILLQERDTAVRELMNEVLVEADYQVLTPDYALDPTVVPNMHPDLIVLDMPKADTSPELDYVMQLKSDSHAAHIPILVLCKSAPSDDVTAWTQQRGIARLLLKPFDLDDFLDAVQHAIESANIATLTGRYESSQHHVDRDPVQPQTDLLQRGDATSD